MPKKNATKSIHSQRLKSIRKYVNFDYDLRKPLAAHQKRKIKTYYDEIQALTARPNQVYRPKSKAKLKTAQEFAQHEKRLPGLKVAFIPTNGKDKTRIRFNKAGEISAATDHVITRGLELNTAELIKDARAHVEKVIAKDKAAKQFTVKAGRYEIPVPHTRATIADFVARLTTKYAAETANNFHGNWLHGLNSHHFTNQSNFSEFNAEKNANKKKLQLKRRNAKARARRAKNK